MTRMASYRSMALFAVVASSSLLAESDDRVRDVNKQRSGYCATPQVFLPADGLLPAERMAAECLNEVQKVIASDISVVALHRAVRATFSQCWGDLSSTSIDIDFSFSGDKDRNHVKRISVSTPRHHAWFEYAGGGILKICSVTLPHDTNESSLKLGLEFFPDGKLKALAYANQKGELVKRKAEWKEDGTLLRSESPVAPRKANLRWKGPPERH
jgi:hypothetical protein